MSTPDTEPVTGVRPELRDSTVPIDAVAPHPRNVRHGNLDVLKESLRAHGQYRPIVVQASTNYIVAGNHTWRAAKDEGWEEIAVTYVACDDEQALRILLVDNRANDVATYDDPALAALLQELIDMPLNLEGTGYSVDDFEDLTNLLVGDTLRIGEPASQANSKYQSAATRGLVLPYSIPDHEKIVRALTELRLRWGLESFAEAVMRAVELNAPVTEHA